jgi:hypothetical protein
MYPIRIVRKLNQIFIRFTDIVYFDFLYPLLVNEFSHITQGFFSWLYLIE